MPAVSTSLGERRTLVQIQALSEAADGLGQMQPAWSTVATAWCLRRALRGAESTNALQVKSVVTFVLETWWIPGLSVTGLNRVLIGGTPYNVEWADDADGRHETLLIYCSNQAAPAAG